ncbi:MAG: polysaccharide deacetylase family protein [Armatimonadetes bacterium]|nr:polysaccharide deacetylase family protein [Armatimonadota bacterium]
MNRRRRWTMVAGLALLGCTAAVAAPVRHAPRLPPVAVRLITHGDRGRKQVALTFDACQTRKPAGYDARLIRILRATHTPATLMLGGRWMETHPAATRSLAADPLFELGNHSYLHPHMTRLTPAGMRAEMQETQDVMYRLTGKQGVLFRPPYGEYDPALISVAARLGLHTLTWEVVTGDPDPHVSAKDIVRAVLERTRPGSIVIMHMNGRGWHTAEALPTVIAALHRRGYRFVTVSQALEPGR